MTDLATSEIVEAAARDAARAADQGRVHVRDLVDLAELAAATDLFGRVWPGEPGSAPCTLDMMRALSKAGNYVSGAFQGEEMVGACVGFFGAPAQAALHSHVAAVVPGLRGCSVGFALKQHQRAWALRRGVNRVSWTFDPLVSRNAYFNLGKLGGTATEYLPNFYGRMQDAVNAGDESDRLVVDWDLRSDRVVAASSRSCDAGTGASHDTCQTESLDDLRARGAVTGLSVDRQGAPAVGSPDGPLVLVGIPPDIVSLRRSDMDTARAWRYALRGVLGGLLDAGGRVTGFARSGWYVVSTP